MFDNSEAVNELVQLTGSLSAPVVLVGKRYIRGYDPVGMIDLLMQSGWVKEE